MLMIFILNNIPTLPPRQRRPAPLRAQNRGPPPGAPASPALPFLVSPSNFLPPPPNLIPQHTSVPHSPHSCRQSGHSSPSRLLHQKFEPLDSHTNFSNPQEPQNHIHSGALSASHASCTSCDKGWLYTKPSNPLPPARHAAAVGNSKKTFT